MTRLRVVLKNCQRLQTSICKLRVVPDPRGAVEVEVDDLFGSESRLVTGLHRAPEAIYLVVPLECGVKLVGTLENSAV